MENNNNLTLEDEQMEAVSGGFDLDIEGIIKPPATHAPAEINYPNAVKPAGIFMTENTELDGNHAKVGVFQWFKNLFGNL